MKRLPSEDVKERLIIKNGQELPNFKVKDSTEPFTEYVLVDLFI